MSILPGNIQPHHRLVVEGDQIELTIVKMVAEMAFPAFSSGTEFFYEMQYISEEVERMMERFRFFGGTFYLYIQRHSITIGRRDILFALEDRMNDAGFRFDIVFNEWSGRYAIDCETVHERYQRGEL